MKNTSTTVCSLLGGIVIGSAITCFYKSHKGEKMRQCIKDFVDEHMEEIKSKYEDRIAQLSK